MPRKKLQLTPRADSDSSSLDLDLSSETTSSSEEQPRSSQMVTCQPFKGTKPPNKIQMNNELMLNNLMACYRRKEQELEETLKQKSARAESLESQLRLAQEQIRKQQALHEQETKAFTVREQQLKETNRKLRKDAGELHSSLQDLDISQEKYQELCNRPKELIFTQEFVAMRFYELVTPLRAQLAELHVKKGSLKEDLETHRTQMKGLMQSYEEERQLRAELELRNQRLILQLADTKQQVQEGDYRQENYPRLKRQRDEMDQELRELKRHFEMVSLSLTALTRERDAFRNEGAALQQTVTLLQKDKDYLNRKLIDLDVRYKHDLELLERLKDQLEDSMKARENVYEKYVASRDHDRMEYENKLRDELQNIRMKNSQEIENLQRTSREIYERESRNLREARDNAVLERDRAREAETHAQSRYNQLLEQFHQLQLNTESRVAEFSNQAKVHSFEAERAQMIKDETAMALVQCQVECDKQKRKLELLTQEFYGLQMSSEKRQAEMQAQNSELVSRLEKYEKLEEELDQAVVKAAGVHEEETQRALFGQSAGASVPTMAKRRLKQSVHLAREVLQLEQENTSLKTELKEHKLRMGQVSEELQTANQLLQQTKQPHSYLVESVRKRDRQINSLKGRISSLDAEVGSLRKERTALQQEKKIMAADLETLLKQGEQLKVMKQTLITMQSRQGHPPNQRKTPQKTATRVCGTRKQ
ncbi:progesterone-induced-blocking factor 1-like [Aulostomus maculatus]